MGPKKNSLLSTAQIRPSAGMTLVGILVGIAALGALVLGILGTVQQVWKVQAVSKGRSDRDNLHEEIRATLSSPAACLSTFGSIILIDGMTNQSLIDIKDDGAPANNRYSVGPLYGDKSLQISSFKFSYRDTAPAAGKGLGTLVISYVQKNVVAEGVPLRPLEILIATTKNTVTNAMVECIALAKMSDGIWRRTPSTLSNVFLTPGSVAIGTVTPEALLHVQDGDLLVRRQSAPAVLHLSGGGVGLLNSVVNLSSPAAGDTWGLQFRADTGNLVFGHASAGLNTMELTRTGRVGIGTANPAANLHVIGSVRLQVAAGGGGFYLCTDPATGLATQGATCALSDKNLKKDIQPLEESLEKIGQLRGVSFLWRDDRWPRSRQVGLIAQDVQAVFPELVEKNGSGRLSVNYNGMVGPIVEAIKELRNEVQHLKVENTKLREALNLKP